MNGVVDLDRHRLVLESDERTQATQRVRGASKSLRAVTHLVHDLSAQPGVGDVDEVSDASGSVGVLESDAARVQPPDQPVAEDLDRGPAVQRNAQGPPEVSAGAKRHHGEPARRRNGRAVVEETVHDLVQRAVTADGDDHRSRLPHCALCDFGRLQRTGREHGFVPEAGPGQPVLDRPPLAACFSRARGGVDDEQDAGPGGYGVPPTARRFMTPCGSMLSLIDCHTRIHPPISSATQRALTRPTPW